MKKTTENRPEISCEFFPPKTEEGELKLIKVAEKLAVLKPRFFSVTFGAGGSTREKTFETVLGMQQATGVEGAPHLSCVGSTRDQLVEIIQLYKDNGIRRIVALRGDQPSGMLASGDLRYANELVELIRQETGDHFHIEVAAYPEVHPQAMNANLDLDNFKRKVDAGADAAITQYFYNAEAYFAFLDACEHRGIDIPIIPGIMPITNFSRLSAFSQACGADIPRWMRKRLECFADDRDSIRAFGREMVGKMCERLLENGTPGLHFYAMNQSVPVLEICEDLNLLPAV